MHYYHLYHTIIETDFLFPQLLKAAPEAAINCEKITILEGIVPSQYKKEENCYSHYGASISYLSNTSCYLLITEGKQILYERKANAKEQYLNSYLLGWGISMLFHQRNCLAIHCSCLSNEHGAILLSGPSGSGKSTHTQYLLEHGYQLMADDLAIVDINGDGPAYACPAFPYQKLCRNVVEEKKLPMEELIYINEEKDKFLVPYKGDFSTKAVPVRGIIMLTVAPIEAPIWEEITGLSKWHACMDTLFLQPLLGDQLYAPEHGQAGLSLASKCAVYHFARPKEQHVSAMLYQYLNKLP